MFIKQNFSTSISKTFLFWTFFKRPLLKIHSHILKWGSPRFFRLPRFQRWFYPLKMDGTGRYDFWSRFLLLHSPFLFPPQKRGKRKGEWCSKNRDQKSYLPVSTSKWSLWFSVFLILISAIVIWNQSFKRICLINIIILRTTYTA